MAGRLAGQVALITGSTSGIGRGCAELFAEEGARIVVHGRRRGLGQEVVDGIIARGGTAIYLYADVADSEQVTALVEDAVAAYGRIDVLMNNAYSGRSASVLDMGEAEWDAAYALMLKAPVLASKAALPHMIAGGGGSIIHAASVHGVLAGRANAPYNAFKAALINLARQMAIDYGRHGVRVNALCPGRIVTESKVAFLEANPDEVRRQQYTYPLGRPGTMRECAYAALFLASDESSFVTGHALVVDGGLTAQLQDAAAKFVEEQVLAELGIDGDG
jgi:NAD(P)-dependent dehydrogenase (short-subunit alcohol dehydrogenase family)